MFVEAAGTQEDACSTSQRGRTRGMQMSLLRSFWEFLCGIALARAGVSRSYVPLRRKNWNNVYTSVLTLGLAAAGQSQTCDAGGKSGSTPQRAGVVTEFDPAGFTIRTDGVCRCRCRCWH